MRKTMRILLVIGNVIVMSMVGLPIAIIGITIFWAYRRLRYRDELDYSKGLTYLLEGLQSGIDRNIAFLKKGDLQAFRVH